MNVVPLKDRLGPEAERLRKKAEELSDGEKRDAALRDARFAEIAAKLYAALPSRWSGGGTSVDKAQTERK
jgi:hypothetical protein